MEEKYAILQGLEIVSMDSLLDFISKEHDFNAIRVPLSVTSVHKNPKASMFGGGVVQRNPSLNNLAYHEILDVVVREAGQRSLFVLLDMHRLSAGDRNNALWWDGSVSEASLIGAWQVLAKRHCESWNVIGADLMNEPWGAAWGHGAHDQDWAAAAERIGAAVAEACPRWLLFVEGVSHTTLSKAEPAVQGQSAHGHMWASNLEGVAHRPLSFGVSSSTATANNASSSSKKLIYSPHVYGPSVAPQPYFDEEGFPSIMNHIWETHFGYVAATGKGCLVVGEWGGWYTGSDAVWQRAFAAWLSKHKIGSFYWSLNPTSRDTGGLVLADWKTPSAPKLEMLRLVPGSAVLVAEHETHEHETHEHAAHEHNGHGTRNASSTR